MKPTCKKCGSIAIIRDDYGVGDDREEAIRCLTCGWRIAKPRQGAPKPDEREKMGSEHHMKYTMIPCARVGCSGKARRGNQRRLCRSCNTRLSMWESGKRTTPPPYIQLADGTWVVNSERARRSAA